MLGNRDPIGARHMQIGDQKVDVVGVIQKSARFYPVGGFENLESGILQNLYHERADEKFILRHQDSLAGLCHRPCLPDRPRQRPK